MIAHMSYSSYTSSQNNNRDQDVQAWDSPDDT